jgi:hypothetical protein
MNALEKEMLPVGIVIITANIAITSGKESLWGAVTFQYSSNARVTAWSLPPQ